MIDSKGANEQIVASNVHNGRAFNWYVLTSSIFIYVIYLYGNNKLGGILKPPQILAEGNSAATTPPARPYRLQSNICTAEDVPSVSPNQSLRIHLENKDEHFIQNGSEDFNIFNFCVVQI